jgi:hypothetical protein
LRARVEAALAARADAARKAEALARDNDLQLNIRPRVWWVAAIGFAWLIVNFAWGAVVRAGWVTFDHRHLLITSLCTLGAYLGGACAVKHTLRAIAVDRRIIDTIGAGLGVAPVVWIVGACLELPPLTTVAMSTPLYFFGLLVLSICVEERVRWLTPFLIPPAIIAGLAPDYAFEMCGVAGFICGVPTAWIWARVIQEEDAAESPPVLTEMQAARARYRVALEGWSEESGVNA